MGSVQHLGVNDRAERFAIASAPVSLYGHESLVHKLVLAGYSCCFQSCRHRVIKRSPIDPFPPRRRPLRPSCASSAYRRHPIRPLSAS